MHLSVAQKISEATGANIDWVQKGIGEPFEQQETKLLEEIKPLDTVSRDHHDDGVVELTGLLQVVQDAADLVVGVGQEPGEHLGHPGEQPLLLVVQRVPGPHGVQHLPLWRYGSGAEEASAAEKHCAAGQCQHVHL